MNGSRIAAILFSQRHRGKARMRSGMPADWRRMDRLRRIMPVFAK